MAEPHRRRRELERLVGATGALLAAGTGLVPNANGAGLLPAAAGAFAVGVVSSRPALRALAPSAEVQRLRFSGLVLVHSGLGLALAVYTRGPVASALWLAAMAAMGIGIVMPLRQARARLSTVAAVAAGAAAVYLLPGLANGLARFAAERRWVFGRPDTPATARAYVLSAVIAGAWAAASAARAAATPDGEARRDLPAARRRPEALLDLVDLHAGYGDLPVLFGASLSVAEGECVALLGTNGAGKSTLLRTAFGLLAPTQGRTWFDGIDVTAVAAERRKAMGMVLVPGGRGVFPSLTVVENLRVAAYRLPDRRRASAGIDEVLGRFPRLYERRDRLAGVLSGGEQQLLALGRAWVARPRLLAVDELTLGLAPAMATELIAALDALRAQGTSILLVDQSVSAALAVTDRAYFLERGTVRFEGQASDLLERTDLLRSVFLHGAAVATPS